MMKKRQVASFTQYSNWAATQESLDTQKPDYVHAFKSNKRTLIIWTG